MDLKKLKSDWKHLLAEEGVNKIFEELDEQLESGTEARDEYFLIKGRINALAKEERLGTLSHDNYKANQNKLLQNLIAFINSLEEKDIVGDSEYLKSAKRRILLEKVIEENIDIREDLGTIHLVNCNRKKSMDLFWTAFDQKIEDNNYFQYYFLLGCPSQTPHSFSERMVYEIVQDSALNNEDNAVHRIINEDNGRIKIEHLPEGRKLEQSQKEFKKYFSNRFSFHKDVSFDDYIKTGIPKLDYDCVTLVFETSENEWGKDTAAYLNWIMGLFNTDSENLPKFIFFFIIRMENIHKKDIDNEKQEDIVREIKCIVSKYPTATLFDPLNPVHEKYLREWLSGIGERSPNRQSIVLDAFTKNLYDKDGKKIEQYKSKQLLNMVDIEWFQEIVYDSYNNNYKK